ncbi:hypothetical protein OA007_02225 [SAR116 cluster bacterium]|nr:hypothetical protein [SAR116 cluster bacterium]
MAHEYKRLDDDDIVKLVDDNVRTSTGYTASDLSKEREKVLDYYNGNLPKPAHDGNSKYVSQDVYNAVQSMQAALLETFAAGNRIVKFAPQGQDDVELAAISTAYADFQIFRANDGYAVFSSVISDALLARVGIAKVFWQMSEEVDQQEFENLTQDELDMILAEENTELIDSETDEIGLVSGVIGITRDTSQVVIEPVAPEEFLIEQQAKSMMDAKFCAHQTRKTLSELREMGFTDEQLDNIGDHEHVDLDTSPEVLARHDDLNITKGLDAQGYQDQVRDVMVIEAYMMVDIEGTGTATLHRILKAGNALLEVEEVSRKPFIAFCPLPIPHSFYGSNFADKLCATQNARTVLTRSILDHAMITNNPRYMVTKGGLTNPRELIDNRVGGLVNVTRPDAIAPMPQAPLNPFIFQTLQELQDNLEENTGVSSLSTGMNKDAVSKQNSAALVEQLTSMSQQRQKIIARNFANQFVKPLFHEVYRLVVENEQQEKIIDISGSFVPVDPRRWKEKRDVMVELKLGYGEQDREAQKMLAIHQLFTQDPAVGPMYGLPQRHAMLKKILEQQGILNVDEYLVPPEQIPPPQPDPVQQMQTQMAAKQLELQERQTGVAEMRAQTDAAVAQAKINLDAEKAAASHALQSDNQDLREAQFDHKVRIDEGELEVLRRSTTDVRGIASPTG